MVFYLFIYFCHGILERALEGSVCLFKSTFPFHKDLGWAHLCHFKSQGPQLENWNENTYIKGLW